MTMLILFLFQSCLELALGIKRVNQLDSSIKMLMASQSNPLSMRRKSSIAMISLPRLGSGKTLIFYKQKKGLVKC